jgi:hypothetical protein
MENNKKFLFVIILFFIVVFIIHNKNNFINTDNTDNTNNKDVFSSIAGSNSYVTPIDDNISNSPYNRLLLGITTDNLIKIGAYKSTDTVNYNSSYWYSFYGERGSTAQTNNISNINSLTHDSYMNFIGCNSNGNFIIGASPNNFNSIDTNYIGGTAVSIQIKDVCRINEDMYCITDTGKLCKALTLIDNISVEPEYKKLVLYLLIYSAYMDSLNNPGNTASESTAIANAYKKCLLKYNYNTTYNNASKKFTEIKKDNVLLYSNQGSTGPKYYSENGSTVIVLTADNNTDNIDERYITIKKENGTVIGYINNSMSLLSSDKESIINHSYFFNDNTFLKDDKISTNIFWGEDLLKNISITIKDNIIKIKSISDNKDNTNILCTGDNGTVFYFNIKSDNSIELTDLTSINTHPMKKVIKLLNGMYLGISDKVVSGSGAITVDENCLYYGVIDNQKLVWNIVNTSSNYPKFKYISNIEFGMKIIN